MTSASWDQVIHVVRRQLNTTDPRVGSARDGSNSTSVLKATEGTNSASFSTLFMTFVPVAIYAAICVIIFLVGRKHLPRVYAPRTFLSSLEPHERTKPLPTGWVNWMKQFWNTPDIEVLHRTSFDGFLFLRYLKILCVICCFGMLIMWPILLPLHTYGGGGNQQLDLLTFGNIAHPSWCYVHAFLAWIFFGFILFMVARECVFFINIRQAYILSPFYANRLSSRTVLFTCVPTQVLDEKKLRRVFGDTVKNVWIPRVTEELDQLVNERDQTAFRLEKAEIELIKRANAAYQKDLKNGHPDIEVKSGPPSDRTSKESKGVDIEIRAESPNSPMSPVSTFSTISPASPREFKRSDGTPIQMTNYGFDGPSLDVVGSVAALWIPVEQRPYHRPIANYGRRVDTIRWTRSRLKALGIQISKLRRDYRKGNGRPIPAVFIEFHSQVDAQAAYQTLAHHSPNHMRPEIVGVRPEEIVWDSLYFSWYSRITRRFLIQGFVAAMVIFWSLPAAMIGLISNIKYLTKTIPFLSWINHLPSIILGLISGLLPAIALSLLMSAVPIIMRMCARQAGVPTESKIELFVQNSYFVFQLVQVFLITTLTSAASAALTQIIENPLSARSLLSKNLPKASNFYISYFILQGLAMSATRLVHMASIFRHCLMANSGFNPRKISARYHRLRVIHWGSVYPVFTNMGIIAITYSLIAPIVLGVAAIGLSIVYISYKYNLLYVYSSERDTRGLCYPRALKQTLTGIYLAEICLIGLFGIKGAYGPVVLMFGLVIFSALFHVSLNDALSPLLYNLPRTLAAEEELLKAGNHPLAAENLEDKHDHDNDFAPNLDPEDGGNVGYDSDFDPSDPTDVSHGQQSSRGGIPVEGADKIVSLSAGTLKSAMRKKYYSSPIPGWMERIDFWSPWMYPVAAQDPKKVNFALKWLHPEVFCNYHILRAGIPAELYNLDASDPTFSDPASSSKPAGSKLLASISPGVPSSTPTSPQTQPRDSIISNPTSPIWQQNHTATNPNAFSPISPISSTYPPPSSSQMSPQTQTQNSSLQNHNFTNPPTKGVHTYSPSLLKDAFSPPSMRKRSPRLWIPRDAAGVSVQEVAHSNKVIEMSDEGAWLDERGRLAVDLGGESDRTGRWVLGEGWGVRF
ncbi:hypothetical protein EG329_011949 [Mollisiaceae sp. DMI_Dod_QoI]|nr:hypothetical protein EG329_011949 [Helotiales sp. DMI_Dod_QoI]